MNSDLDQLVSSTPARRHAINRMLAGIEETLRGR
jgi:hypothetical protein